jgi:MFS family permease
VINACLSGSLNVLGPVVADQSIGRRTWGFVLAAQTAGMVLGALVAIRLRARRMLLVGVLCCVLLALPVLALAFTAGPAPAGPMVVVLLGAAFVTGLGVEQFAVAWETTMQEHVPADRLARVYSYDMVGSYVAMPVGQVIAGPVGQAVGVAPALTGAAGLILLAVLAMLTSSDVRHLEHRPPPRRLAPVEESPA